MDIEKERNIMNETKQDARTNAYQLALGYIAEQASKGLETDGAHHKQYFLEDILAIADTGMLQRLRKLETFDAGIIPPDWRPTCS